LLLMLLGMHSRSASCRRCLQGVTTAGLVMLQLLFNSIRLQQGLHCCLVRQQQLGLAQVLLVLVPG
jgi:hypothetical protein